MNAFVRVLALSALSFLFINPVRGNAIFTFGNNPQPNEENVLLSNGTTGTTVFGTTNQTMMTVDFSSTQMLTEPVSGQARIEATDGTSQVALTNISFSLANGGTFEDAIFDMNLLSGTDTATITAVTNDGTFNLMMALGTGQNFLTITTTGGELLQSVSISATNGFTDLRAIRISGAAAAAGVPDRGATLPLLATAMICAGIVRFMGNTARLKV